MAIISDDQMATLSLDQDIEQAAKANGIDPAVLRAVGQQETGLGTSQAYNARTGLSRMPGNAGHGIFQLDPASGASADELRRVAADPSYAAQVAAKMLKRNLDASGGDVRKALAMYNAGSADSAAGQQYAQAVLARMPTPASSGPAGRQDAIERVPHDRNRADHLQRLGRPITDAEMERMEQGHPAPGAPTSSASATAGPTPPAAGGSLTDRLHGVWSYLTDPQNDAMTAIFGAPQRGVGAVMYALEHHENVHQTIAELYDDITHADNTARTTEAARAFLNGAGFLPDKATIDKTVNQYVPAEWRPYVGGFIKAENDFVAQTITDPLTYLGGAGVWEKGAHAIGTGLQLLKGYKLTQIAAQAMRARGLTMVADQLDRIGGAYHQAHTAVNEFAHELFAQRPDLDKFFTPEAKQARMQIEKRALAAHGTLHSQAARDQVANETEAYLRRYGGAKGQIVRMKDVPTESAASREIASLSDPKKHPVLSKVMKVADAFRNLVSVRVFSNPLPHGVSNVGELATWAGGWRMPFDAMRYMASSLGTLAGRTGAHVAEYGKDLQRLHSMGAFPDYMSGMTRSIYNKVPGWGPLIGQMQHGLQEMEAGWRIATLRKLDRVMGASKNARDELLKGYMVESAAGDYRNQAAFTQLFRVIGGPFAVFHYGIVPRALLNAIATHPERVLAMARQADDLQNNRALSSQAENLLNLPGSPLRAAMHPAQFLTSPTTEGIPGEIQHAQQTYQFHGAGRTILDEANRILNPFGDITSIAAHAAFGTGKPMPNAKYGAARFQPEGFADRLTTAVLEAFGGYYSRQKGERYQKALKREQKIETKRQRAESRTPWYDDL